MFHEQRRFEKKSILNNNSRWYTVYIQYVDGLMEMIEKDKKDANRESRYC